MTLSDLKNYILRKLGHPVINIEIAEEQLTDTISDALEVFCEYHTDGVDIGYVFLDLVAGQSEYTMPDNVSEVLHILSASHYMIDTEEPLLLKPFYLGNTDFYQDFNLIDVEIFRQNLQNVKNTLETGILFDYNPTSKKLTLFEIPKANKKIALHIYKSNEDLSKIYNNRWFKQYAVALSGLQWVNNISKYEGGRLPGGVTFNAATLEERYRTQKDILEDELHDRFEEPPDPVVG